MTHIDNIPHILQHGITHRASRHRDRNFLTIGDVSLIDYRSRKTISIDNGDLISGGGSVVTLGDFIPFYFGVKMPMLYVMQHGGNFVEMATRKQDIIYLVCHLKDIIDSDIDFYFSDGHATDRMTSFYDREHVDRLPDLIDWDAVNANYWGGPENLVTKRKKQAELLVSSDIPPDFIFELACYDAATRDRLVNMNLRTEMIKVVPDAYF